MKNENGTLNSTEQQDFDLLDLITMMGFILQVQNIEMDSVNMKEIRKEIKEIHRKVDIIYNKIVGENK